MKKYFKYALVLSLLLLGVLAFNPKVNHQLEAKQSIETPFHSKSNTLVGLPQLTGTAYAEISTSVLSSLPTVNSNNGFNNHSYFNKISNHLIAVELKQYFSKSIKLLLANRKANLIFPFHYFW